MQDLHELMRFEEEVVWCEALFAGKVALVSKIVINCNITTFVKSTAIGEIRDFEYVGYLL